MTTIMPDKYFSALAMLRKVSLVPFAAALREANPEHEKHDCGDDVGHLCIVQGQLIVSTVVIVRIKKIARQYPQNKPGRSVRA